MIGRKFFAGAVLATSMFAAVCGAAEAKPMTPVQTVASKLECGGSYYMISDIDALKPQLNAILDMYAASLPDGKIKSLDVEFVQVRAIAELVCKYLGADRLQAYGGSSTVLVPADAQQTAVYHNRSVLVMDCSDPKPLLVRLMDGEKTKLADFAARVPDDALVAAVANLNSGELLSLLKSIPQLPPEVFAMLEEEVKKEFNCSLADFCNGISGKVELIVYNADLMSADTPQMMLAVPDKGNRIFQAVCREEAKDPAKVTEVAIDDVGVFVRKQDRIELYLGKGSREKFNQKLAAGKTMAADKNFIKFTGKLPAEAHAYAIGKLNLMTNQASEINSVSAVVFEKNCMVCYSNDQFDYNGQLVLLIFGALKQFDEFSGLKDMIL